MFHRGGQSSIGQEKSNLSITEGEQQLRDPRCRCVRYNRPEASELSVFGWREGPVVSGPRKDAATENQVCIRKHNRGENKRPDTSMRSVSC
jgi:hypothetical protein